MQHLNGYIYTAVCITKIPEPFYPCAKMHADAVRLVLFFCRKYLEEFNQVFVLAKTQKYLFLLMVRCLSNLFQMCHEL